MLLLLAAVLSAGCQSKSAAIGTTTTTTTTSVDASSSNPSAAVVDPAPRTENVSVPNDRPIYVQRRASHLGPGRNMIFLAGMCVHPAGYVMSFQSAASARGDIIGLEGDVACGGDPNSPMRMWSSDLNLLDRRIDAAFVAAGLGKPEEVLVMGYSQGAERVEKLVARWPEKYSRAVLIASPITPSPRSFARTKGVTLMAGSFDISRDRMQSAASTMKRAGIHASYVDIPNGRHGQLGDTPDPTMRAALDALEPY